LPRLVVVVALLVFGILAVVLVRLRGSIQFGVTDWGLGNFHLARDGAGEIWAVVIPLAAGPQHLLGTEA
jgi:hypothetical protein